MRMHKSKLYKLNSITNIATSIETRATKFGAKLLLDIGEESPITRALANNAACSYRCGCIEQRQIDVETAIRWIREKAPSIAADVELLKDLANTMKGE